MAGGELERVGVRDVAARAGVSTQTVSRVINDRPHIRPETRARVLAAMAELGYRVNNAARALGTSRTRTVGVLASDATLYGPSVGIAALEAAARAEGRWIATAYADGSDDDSVREAVEHLLAQGIDGLVVLAPHRRTIAAVRAAAPGMPLSALHAGLGAARQRTAAALVVDHLVTLGHQRIGRLAGPGDWLEAVARDAGAVAALERQGLPRGSRWEGDWSAAAGRAAALPIAAAARAHDGPTAIVVANDQMALGLMAGLDAAGIRVPADVSVAGFDDNPDAAFYRPSLTTVRLDLPGEALRALAEALGSSGGSAGGSAVVPERGGFRDPAAPALVVRDSTAPPRD